MRNEQESALISRNSSLSNPVPLSEGTPLRASQSAALPQPSEQIDSIPVAFTGTGGEYFRIWIVNLLLIMVTFGFYYPWAKVRKLKYFYNNTQLGGHALEFHGEAKKMLRGSLIVGVFFMIYSVAVDFSAVAGAIAILAFLALAPVLFRASMRFRLANTSWRGMRMRFVAADMKEAYWCITPALALLLLPGMVLAFFANDAAPSKGSPAITWIDAVPVGLYALLVVVAIPYFFWRLKRYQHNHYAWGPLKTEYRSEVGATYKVFGLTALLAAGIIAAFFALFFVLLPSGTGSIRSGTFGAIFSLVVPMTLLFFVVINILPRAYFSVSMQNLLWSRTGNHHVRFKSDLQAGQYIGLQFKNYFLILLTLGLYWPFAVVNTTRMQLQAISLKTRISLDQLTDAARARENDAAGDMAADIFGFDVGM
jgi:uncharacterized membrane protein YjgN (DUF898 family)